MLTLREVSLLGFFSVVVVDDVVYYILFHSKMGIKELISNIKDPQIYTETADAKKIKHSHGILFLFAAEKNFISTVFLCTSSLMIDLILIL